MAIHGHGGTQSPWATPTPHPEPPWTSESQSTPPPKHPVRAMACAGPEQHAAPHLGLLPAQRRVPAKHAGGVLQVSGCAAKARPHAKSTLGKEGLQSSLAPAAPSPLPPTATQEPAQPFCVPAALRLSPCAHSCSTWLTLGRTPYTSFTRCRPSSPTPVRTTSPLPAWYFLPSGAPTTP